MASESVVYMYLSSHCSLSPVSSLKHDKEKLTKRVADLETAIDRQVNTIKVIS